MATMLTQMKSKSPTILVNTCETQVQDLATRQYNYNAIHGNFNNKNSVSTINRHNILFAFGTFV